MSKSKAKSAKNVTIGLTRTATGTTYDTDDVIDYQTYRAKQPKKKEEDLYLEQMQIRII